MAILELPSKDRIIIVINSLREPRYVLHLPKTNKIILAYIETEHMPAGL